jgi:methylglutaconyl-CoA hydratase
LAAVCDFVVAAQDATFTMTDAKYANIPAVGLYFLIRRIGEGRTRELLFTASPRSAQEAKAIGLVYQVADVNTLDANALAFAQQIAETITPGVGDFLKKMLADLPGMPYEDALNFAAKINAHGRSTDEFRDGLRKQMAALGL